MRHVDGRSTKQVARTIATAIGALTILVATSGCVSIPQRAWDNGRNISSSHAYRAMLHGDRSVHNMRRLYSSMDPYRSLYTPRPYAPFGRW